MELYTRDLLDRLFSRKQTYNDQLLIQKGLEDPRKADAIKKIAGEQWDEWMSSEPQDQVNLQDIYYKLHYKISKSLQQSRTTRLWQVFSRVAAILFIPLLIISTVYLFDNFQVDHPAMVEMNFSAPAGTRSEFILPDGTSGWLNAGSHLIYTAGFSTARQVSLEGEAFFNVRKDAKHPFLVKTKTFDIQVTGTRFSVYSYPEEDWADLVLESGKVTINNHFNGQKLKVMPGQRFTISQKNGNFNLGEVNVEEYIEWTEGKLYLRNEPMDVVAGKLERFYSVDVEFADKEILQYSFRAMLQNEALEDVLRFMEISLPVSATLVPVKKQNDGTFSKRKVILKMRSPMTKK
jgi:transmembrane sensor